MSELQEQAEIAWNAISTIKISGWCKHPRCYICPVGKIHKVNCNVPALQGWLHTNGFPSSRQRIHTVTELAKQIIKGRSLPCLAQWIAQRVEAVTCPGCGKHTLYRERRMVCNGCNDVYPADKWDNGEPCECGCMDARYFGIYSVNQLGQLEFQRCETPGCRWAGGRLAPLTVQELADAAQIEAEVKLYETRTCPACGEASGNDQNGGVYLPIERCACGWRK